jgi:hypothetical protein
MKVLQQHVREGTVIECSTHLCGPGAMAQQSNRIQVGGDATCGYSVKAAMYALQPLQRKGHGRCADIVHGIHVVPQQLAYDLLQHQHCMARFCQARGNSRVHSLRPCCSWQDQHDWRLCDCVILRLQDRATSNFGFKTWSITQQPSNKN